MDGEPKNERPDLGVRVFIANLNKGFTERERERAEEISRKVSQMSTGEESAVGDITNYVKEIDDNKMRLLAFALFSQRVVDNRPDSKSRTEEQRDMEAGTLLDSFARSLHNELHPSNQK